MTAAPRPIRPPVEIAYLVEALGEAGALRLIEQATGKPAYAGEVADEGEDIQGDEDSVEAEMTIAL